MTGFKQFICTTAGVIGAGIASIFGGWSASMTTLIIFLAIDYITGIIVAGVFKKSPKSDNGGLESKAGLKGLLRKGAELLLVLVACRLDILIGSNYCRDATVIALCVNETISIIENVGVMGVPIPEPIRKAIARLRNTDKKE